MHNYLRPFRQFKKLANASTNLTADDLTALADITATDDRCAPLVYTAGDANSNDLLDVTESWVYTCTTVLKPKGTYTMEFRVLSNGIEVTRQAMVVTAN